MIITSLLMLLLLFHDQSILLTSTEDIPNALQNLYCDLGLKNDCPIDGGWTSWSLWRTCSGKCGFKGKRMRYRTCSNPLPSNKGATCSGTNYEIENCQIMGCTMEEYEKVVSTDLVRRSQLNIVKESHKKMPALIDLCFLVDCIFSTVEKIIKNNAMTYWNAMNCVKYNVGCPITGGWNSWEPWSTCSAICGRGQKYRTRVCNNPIPSTSKLKCNNSAFELKSCVGANCKKSLSGIWGNWSRWSTCSVDCGSGIQIRKRSCSEMETMQATPCKGSSVGIKGCVINSCSVNGMWSSWTSWTPCTSICGIGTQMRNRMCNNPPQSGNGSPCFGSASEVRQCFTKPCKVKSHEVAQFMEKSTLLYNANGRPIHLFHMYIRFLSFSSFGVIVHRFEENCDGSTCDYIKLFLRNRKIVLLAQISGCSLALISESKLEIGQWHVVLTAIYGTRGILRINNGPHKIHTFSCIPISHNLYHAMVIGGGFQGQVQELAINFASVQLRLLKDGHNQKYGTAPVSGNNIQYMMGEENEGLIYVRLTESVVVPCPKNMEDWHVTIALKPDNIDGIVAVIPDDTLNKYILLFLEEGRIKLKIHQRITYVVIESIECISVNEWFEVIIAQDGENMYIQINGNSKKYVPLDMETVIITSPSYIYLGAMQDKVKERIFYTSEEIPQMSFTLGYLIINKNKIDLISLSVYDTISKQFSSRSISISDYYEEVPLVLGEEMKLSCFYGTLLYEREPRYTKTNILWLLMDQLLECSERSNFYNVYDDGRISTISIASYTTRDSVENFYSCHIYHYKNESIETSGQAHFTFGITIIDKNKGLETVLWKKWIFICGVISGCIVLILIWCLLELLQDIRNGYGFYRLSRMSSNDPRSTVSFVLSKSGLTLLGSQEAVNEIISKILEG